MTNHIDEQAAARALSGRVGGIGVVYALILIGAGVAAYMLAPEGANAGTALIVPSACAAIILLIAVLTFVGGRKKLRPAKFGRVAMAIAALLFAGAFAGRALPSSNAADEYAQGVEQFEAAVAAGERENTPEARLAYLEEIGAPDHSKRYLANTLWSLTAVSVFVVLLLIVAGKQPPAGTPAQTQLEV